MLRMLCVLLLIALSGCGDDDGLFDIDLSEEEPRPLIENGGFCPRTDTYWSCESDLDREIDFAAYDEEDGGLFESDGQGAGILIVRPGTVTAQSSTTFDYDKPKKNRVDLVLSDGGELTFRGVQGSSGTGFLSFDIDGGDFEDEAVTCELVTGFLDGDCDGEPGGERNPACEIVPFPGATPIPIPGAPTCTATPEPTATQSPP